MALVVALVVAMAVIVLPGAGIVAVMPGMGVWRRCIDHGFVAGSAQGAQHRRSHCTASCGSFLLM